jgi:hypothetical protein
VTIGEGKVWSLEFQIPINNYLVQKQPSDDENKYDSEANLRYRIYYYDIFKSYGIVTKVKSETTC